MYVILNNLTVVSDTLIYIKSSSEHIEKKFQAEIHDQSFAQSVSSGL